MGTYFREVFTEKLDADFHIGLSPEHDNRVAELIPPEPAPELSEWMSKDEIEEMGRNNKISVAATKTREFRQAEVPASNGHGNARSMAQLGSIVACGGTLNGIQFLTRKTIDDSIKEQIYLPDSVLMRKQRYGLGWGLPSPENPLTPNWKERNACYWGGWGGSRLLMDLDQKLCFTYAMNNMIMTLTGDSRSYKINRAVYECLGEEI